MANEKHAGGVTTVPSTLRRCKLAAAAKVSPTSIRRVLRDDLKTVSYKMQKQRELTGVHKDMRHARRMGPDPSRTAACRVWTLYVWFLYYSILLAWGNCNWWNSRPFFIYSVFHLLDINCNWWNSRPCSLLVCPIYFISIQTEAGNYAKLNFRLHCNKLLTLIWATSNQ